ncbi:MAG: LamG domain-containing protein, partial [Bacteroidota bacterium]
MGSTVFKNWWLHTLPSSTGKGVRFGVGKGNSEKTELDFTFPDATKNNWHNIAASYNGSSLLLYVDGNLVGSKATTIAVDSMPLFFGQTPAAARFYKGHLDEVRFFNRQLAQTEVQQFMKQSGNADLNGLVAYWKLDEGVGNKAFDLTSNRFKLYFCGPQWDNIDKPEVVNTALTDASGFYKLVGINYGAGNTFTVTPSKIFYFNQSIEFNASNAEYADLTN